MNYIVKIIIIISLLFLVSCKNNDKEVVSVIEEKDLDTIANLYSDDFVGWHNYDQIERNRSQALDSAKWVSSEIENFGSARLCRDFENFSILET